jgi:hypothetical protein
MQLTKISLLLYLNDFLPSIPPLHKMAGNSQVYNFKELAEWNIHSISPHRKENC